ncbi:MAG TPA: hypothetical protein VFZ65_01135 [Planctomycetota bacterium]|nr:hypothetical protein [Planctomycetota bacterium]
MHTSLVLSVATSLVTAAAMAQTPAPARQDPATQDPATQDPATLRQELRALTERVEELEEQAVKTSDQVGGRSLLQAYTAKSVDVGGHVSSLFTYMKGEDKNEAGHVVTLVELYLRARVDESWSLFATPGFYVFNGGLLDDPATPASGDPAFVPDNATEAGLFLSRAYAEYSTSDLLRLRGGVVGTPHGPANREYFIPARMIAQPNLHTRVFLANQLYPTMVRGVTAAGKVVLAGGKDRVEYDAYYGVQDVSPSDGLGGARLAYVFDDWGLSIAANYGRGTRQGFPPEPASSPTPAYTGNVAVLQSPFPSRVNLTRDYEFSGIDIDWRHGDFMNKTELYYSAEADVADKRAVTTEWNWFFQPAWVVSYRFDYFDAGADLDPLGTAVVLQGHATEHVLGLCYTPSESVRLRLDLHHLLLPNTDDTVDFVNLSWSVSF